MLWRPSRIVPSRGEGEDISVATPCRCLMRSSITHQRAYVGAGYEYQNYIRRRPGQACGAKRREREPGSITAGLRIMGPGFTSLRSVARDDTVRAIISVAVRAPRAKNLQNSIPKYVRSQRPADLRKAC